MWNKLGFAINDDNKCTELEYCAKKLEEILKQDVLTSLGIAKMQLTYQLKRNCLGKFVDDYSKPILGLKISASW
ncbi:MAG: hypothetical protein FWD82_10750 [Defluviitaleaceae bacterium]|nr:hypothetical protein [Defluviitaleaceae bacterium]